MNTFTETDLSFLNAMREAIKEKGAHYVYEQREFVSENGAVGTTCDYIRDGEPSCLVGHGIVNTPAIDDGIIEEGNAAWEVLQKASGLSYAVAQAANDIQGEQDSGTPWGKAWESGLNYLENINDFHGAWRYDVSSLRL